MVITVLYFLRLLWLYYAKHTLGTHIFQRHPFPTQCSHPRHGRGMPVPEHHSAPEKGAERF